MFCNMGVGEDGDRKTQPLVKHCELLQLDFPLVSSDGSVPLREGVPLDFLCCTSQRSSHRAVFNTMLF